jgi:hypothetical protein
MTEDPQLKIWESRLNCRANPKCGRRDRGIHPMPMTIEFAKNVLAQCKKRR